MNKSLYSVGLVVASIAITLLCLEGAIRAYGYVRTKYGAPSSAMYIPDPILGHRPNSNYPGHDKRGWRNTAALDQVEIVALGDSQTYGLNVPVEGAWPQRLGKLLDVKVYQMAFGGYGPANYAVMADDALSLHPSVVVAAYYFGNDILDSYQLAYNEKPEEFKRRANDPLLSSFQTHDPKMLKALKRAEEIDPRFVRHGYLDCQAIRSVPDPNFQQIHNVLELPLLRDGSFSGVAAQYSILYQFLSAKMEAVKGKIFKAPPPRDYGPPICVQYKDTDLATMFTPGYRLLTLADSDPRIIEGKRISLLAFESLAKQVERGGAKFLVVLIPTKEYAFRKHVEATIGNQPYLLELWDAERRAREEAIVFFEHKGIQYADALSFLERDIDSGVNPYPKGIGIPRIDGDGHPAQEGYDAIAASVAEKMRTMAIFR